VVTLVEIVDELDLNDYYLDCFAWNVDLDVEMFWFNKNCESCINSRFKKFDDLYFDKMSMNVLNETW